MAICVALTAVHLPGTYKLVQVHAHWDQVGSNNGSEHTVNGLGYAGEVIYLYIEISLINSMVTSL